MTARMKALLTLFVSSLVAGAAPPKELALRQPAVRSVFPLGGQTGQRVSLELEGEFLDRATTVRCECDDLRTTVQSVNALRVVAEIDIPGSAEPGPRTLYLESPRGSSNRFLFRVTRWTSIVEQEPNDVLERAQPVPNPSVVEGRIARLTDTDFFRFHASAGERLAFNVLTARSKAPGFISLTLLTAEGRELAHNNSGIGPDPFLEYKFDKGADYVVVLTARRFADFFTVLKDDQLINWQYQLLIGRGPLLWSVFPMGGKRGRHVDAELCADFLPSGTVPKISGSGVEVRLFPGSDPCGCRHKLSIDIAADATAGMRLLSVPDDSGNTAALGFAVGEEPEILESDTKPQKIELPVTINGRIAAIDERDVFRFKVNQDDEVTFEVNAREFGSQMTDPQLALLRPQGDIVSFGDDRCQKCSPLQSMIQKKKTLDPKFTHAFISASANDADAAGEYDIILLDNASRGGETSTYRLTARKKLPRYSAGVLTDHVNAKAGAAAKIPVAVAREEGFQGSITVSALNLPAGWSARPLTIPAGAESGDLEIEAGSSASSGNLEIRFEATIAGQVVRQIAEAPPLLTEDGPGFLELPRHRVALAFVAGTVFELKVEEPSNGFVIDLKKSSHIEIPVTMERSDSFKEPLEFRGENLPEGVIMKSQRSDGKSTYITLEADPRKVKTGRYRIAASAAGRLLDREVFDVTPALRLQVK